MLKYTKDTSSSGNRAGGAHVFYKSSLLWSKAFGYGVVYFPITNKSLIVDANMCDISGQLVCMNGGRDECKYWGNGTSIGTPRSDLH